MGINFFVKIIIRGYGHVELVSYVKDCKYSVISQIFDTDEVMNIWKVLENKDKYTNRRFFSFLKDMGKSEMHYEIVFNKPVGYILSGCKADDYRITIYKEPDKIRMKYFTGEKARVIMEKLTGNAHEKYLIFHIAEPHKDDPGVFVQEADSFFNDPRSYINIKRGDLNDLCLEMLGKPLEEISPNSRYKIQLIDHDMLKVTLCNSGNENFIKTIRPPASINIWETLHPEKKVEVQDFSNVMDPQILGEAEWEKEFGNEEENDGLVWNRNPSDPPLVLGIDQYEDKIDQNINNPDHYTKGRKYEPIDVINDWELNFNLGNVVKYISRYNRKGNVPVEDLKKAAFYLNDEIERLIKK